MMKTMTTQKTMYMVVTGLVQSDYYKKVVLISLKWMDDRGSLQNPHRISMRRGCETPSP